MLLFKFFILLTVYAQRTARLGPPVAVSISFVYWKTTSTLCLLSPLEQLLLPLSHCKMKRWNSCWSACLGASWINCCLSSIFLCHAAVQLEKVQPYYTTPPWCSALDVSFPLLVYNSIHGAVVGYMHDNCMERHSSASGLRLWLKDK